MCRNTANEPAAGSSSATQRCTSRLVYAPSFEDMAREIGLLGIDAEQAGLLASHLHYRAVKLERVDLNSAIRLRDIVERIGGKAVLSAQGSRERGLADLLIVGNVSCMTTFLAELRFLEHPWKEVAQDLEQAVRAVVDKPDELLRMNAGGKILDFSSRTYIMGILNITPDSFSDGGAFFDHQKAVEQAYRMVEEGADIIDIGGESTRPNAPPVTPEEELRRVIPVIEAVAGKMDVLLSVDTSKSRIAEEALAAGAHIINDVSALRFDPSLAGVAARTGVPIVLMHMRGTPATMQQNISYEDTISEIIAHLRDRIAFAEQAGIRQGQIIIDPGIGFGKSLERDNFTILRNLEEFASLGKPILVGPSRKAFLGKLMDLPVEDRVEATAAAISVAIMNGANIVRVHDVKAMKRVATVVNAVKKAAPIKKLRTD